MIIDSRLGPHEIVEDKIIIFPRGLIGYEFLQKFVLLQINENSPLLVLQSIEDPNTGLLVTDPYSFMEEYTVNISKADQEELKTKDKENLAVLVTVSIPPGKPDNTALNLLGPILINHEIKKGLQVPQTNPSGPDKFFLNPLDGVPKSTAKPTFFVEDS